MHGTRFRLTVPHCDSCHVQKGKYLLNPRLLVHRLLRPKGKVSFLESILVNGKLLDVGCGNDSPLNTRLQRPDLVYYGLDVGDYNQQDPGRYADHYILTSPEYFAAEIEGMKDTFDAVVSSQNIEHCSEPERVLIAMLHSLKTGGRLYMSFPCEASTMFPTRYGTLNFYDDSSHVNMPNYDWIVDTIIANGFKIEFMARRYRPFIGFLLGLLLEPFGRLLKRNMPYAATWMLYGYESVIWAAREAGGNNDQSSSRQTKADSTL